MKRSNLVIICRLAGLARPLAPFMLVAILAGVAGFICSTFIPVFGGYALLSTLDFTVPYSIKSVFACVLVFALLRGVFRYLEQYCNHYIAFRLLALIRDQVFRALRRLCPAKLEGKDKGNLISVITSDIELLEVFYAHTISPAAIALCMSVLMTLFIGRRHWLLGGIAAAGYATVGIVIPLLVSKAGGDKATRFRNEIGDLNTFILDSLRGLGEILQYHAGGKRLREMTLRASELSAREEQLKEGAGRNAAATNAVILSFSVGMLFASTRLHALGALEFDGALISTIAMMSSFGPVTALANLGSGLQQTFAAGNRVMDLLDETPSVAEVTGGRAVGFDGIACENICFSYGDEPVLTDFSLAVAPGKIIGIVGRSGSGKSTLLKLMMRFWDVGRGRISLSRQDLRQINTDNLRTLESFVTQETHLFHDSIENNIRIARLDATRDEIVQACKKASLHEFITTLPRGYDTNAGELGEALSSGERQRVGIARAFLHNSPLVLLDEPTSNLDSLNEAVILRSLDKERADRTIVLVSHRKSTVRMADEVYLVDNGRMS